MINDDLRETVISERLPEEIIKNHNRVLQLYLSLGETKSLVTQLITNQTRDCDMTIKECSDLMKAVFISKEIDHELMKKMARQAKTFKELEQLFTAGFHYRKDSSYSGFITKELSMQEINCNVWLEVLNYKDPWYFRISTSLERLTLLKIFNACNSEKIIEISEKYFKKSNFSTNTMLSSLSDAQISIDTCKEIKDISKRKEIKKIVEEKINHFRIVKNHKITKYEN